VGNKEQRILKAVTFYLFRAKSTLYNSYSSLIKSMYATDRIGTVRRKQVAGITLYVQKQLVRLEHQP